MAKTIFIVLSTFLMLNCQASIGQSAKPLAEDPVLEKKVNEVSNELRCLVCQNQTIADSNAELAVDLKNQVRKQISEGRSKDEILQYMVARYGDFVLYSPPLKASTWALWIGPFILLIVALLLLIWKIRQRRIQIEEEYFQESELVRARQLLHESSDQASSRSQQGVRS